MGSASASHRSALPVPLLVNGDILPIADAERALEKSGADGVMVGRGVLRNPWLLRQISESFRGEEIHEPTLGERRGILLKYFDQLGESLTGEAEWLERATLGRIKKATGYFTKGLPYGSKLRERIFHSHEIAHAKAHLNEYFDLLEQHRVRTAFVDVHDEATDPARLSV